MNDGVVNRTRISHYLSVRFAVLLFSLTLDY